MIAATIFNILIKKRWLFSCLFLFSLSACHENGAPDNRSLTPEQVVAQQTAARVRQSLPCLDSARQLVQDGDLITRTGIDFTSQSLRQFCRHDKTYSHCGIISIEQNNIFVYHALGGEINPDQKLKKETLTSFCDALDNAGFGLFRFALPAAHKQLLHEQVQAYYNAGLPFDMDFDLHTDSAMYCTEFVSKLLEQASGKTIRFTSSVVNGFEYMAADNIFLHKNCREIHRYVY
jgi:hypothetical protein